MKHNQPTLSEHSGIGLKANLDHELVMHLRRARKQAKMTQKELARRMGIQTTAVTKLERSMMTGKHSPMVTTLRRYAAALGYGLDIHLISLEEEERLRQKERERENAS